MKPPIPLHEMDWHEATRWRWRAGRADRGLTDNDPFEGEPLLEAYEELVDAWTYLNLGGEAGLADDIRRLGERLRAAIQHPYPRLHR
jgi:hypothetical protein